MRIRKRSPHRLEVVLTKATSVAGWALVCVGARLVLAGTLWISVAGLALMGTGGVLATLRRTMVFDREAGLFYSEQRLFGFRRRMALPLFHLRAVVVSARRRGNYVAFVERRSGGTIHLDEGHRPGELLSLAEAVADVAGLRLVYDATTRVAVE